MISEKWRKHQQSQKTLLIYNLPAIIVFISYLVGRLELRPRFQKECEKTVHNGSTLCPENRPEHADRLGEVKMGGDWAYIQTYACLPVRAEPHET